MNDTTDPRNGTREQIRGRVLHAERWKLGVIRIHVVQDSPRVPEGTINATPHKFQLMFVKDADCMDVISRIIEERDAALAREAKETERIRAYIQERIERVKADERYSYPPATTFENAGLALVQVQMKTEVRALEGVLILLADRREEPKP